MSVEITCDLCDRPTRNVTRYWCHSLQFHVLCWSCVPLLHSDKAGTHHGEPIVKCPDAAPEELRVIAAMRDPEVIPLPALGGEEFMAKLFKQSLDAAITLSEAHEKVSDAMKISGMSVQELRDLLDKLKS